MKLFKCLKLPYKRGEIYEAIVHTSSKKKAIEILNWGENMNEINIEQIGYNNSYLVEGIVIKRIC